MSQPLKALNLKYPDFSENHRGTVLPSLELPQLSPTHLSLPLPLWCFCGWEAVTKGTGCHCHHGDGLRRASQLLRGTINKHQSLVNISPAGTEQQPGPTALGSTGDVSWRGGGRQKGTGSRQDGNNSAETRGMMRWVRQQKAGGSEKDEPQFSTEQQKVSHFDSCSWRHIEECCLCYNISIWMWIHPLGTMNICGDFNGWSRQYLRLDQQTRDAKKHSQ